jgi:hypothetical protein
MKQIMLLGALLVAVPCGAQEHTLLGSGSVDHGGYGALVVKFTPINNELGVLVGARGGWIINHTFSIGLAGYGLATQNRALQEGPPGYPYVNMGYGGLDLEFIMNSDELVHVSIHTLIGAGAVGFRMWNGDGWWSGDPLDGTRDDHYGTFFVIEPGLNLDLNVTAWFRASIGAAYRHAGGVSSRASTGTELSGPSGMLTFRFGSF